jgi:hypothetical protein
MFRRRRIELYERREIRYPQLTHEEELLAQEIALRTGTDVAIVRRWLREQKFNRENRG